MYLGPRWGPGGPDECPPKSLVGLALRAVPHAGISSPRTMLMNMIAWYQKNVSAGRSACSRTDGPHCSAYGMNVVTRYGAIVGSLLAVRYVASCGKCNDNYGYPTY